MMSERQHTSSKGIAGAGTTINSFTHLNLPATLFPDDNIVTIGKGIRNNSGAWSDTHTHPGHTSQFTDNKEQQILQLMTSESTCNLTLVTCVHF